MWTLTGIYIFLPAWTVYCLCEQYTVYVNSNRNIYFYALSFQISEKYAVFNRIYSQPIQIQTFLHNFSYFQYKKT